MGTPTTSETLSAWARIPESISSAIEGLTEDEINLRGGSEGWSIRETVHHLVEANLIASNIIIAALANSGSTYDWSWVNPDRSWMKRLAYDTTPIEPAVETLKSLSLHLSGVLLARKGALRCEIKLLDAPDAELRPVTVEEVLREEVEHAKEHLRDLKEAQRRRAR